MSENHHSAPTLPELFTPTEIEQFGADDVTAGRAIGKMLSLLFLYTVVVMAVASWWTFSSISADSAETPAVEVHAE
ncbi:MAG: hypothetical protein KDA96_00345 [Planctomycetaceae bacterium]|nr:hypothetical protein [Planctomycetaceae bacterium]